MALDFGEALEYRMEPPDPSLPAGNEETDMFGVTWVKFGKEWIEKDIYDKMT